MTETTTRLPASDDSAIRERRRPGRTEVANPALIPMLRGEFVPDDVLDTERLDEAPQVTTTDHASTDAAMRDDLSAARGMMLGAVLSLGAWAIIGAIIWRVCGF